MNTPIYNRENEAPADGWYQIEVSGTHPAGDGRRYGVKEGLTAFVEVSPGEITYRPEEHYSKLQAKISKVSKDKDNLLWSREEKSDADGKGAPPR